MKTVFLTGACGGMGIQGLMRMVEDADKYKTLILVRDSEKNRKILKEYENCKNLEIVWGDLNEYKKVYDCVAKSDLILHVAAFVSPAADYHPKKAMEVNYGSTVNLITAIKEQGRENEVKFVYIGTVAETGDRMPPIHWGRVGDPIKPSMFDYYAVSKVAAERYVIESGLKYWVSLRQTGIIGDAMSAIRDAIMFHNCYDNVLEYVSDRDSGVLLRNLSLNDATDTMKEGFWGHIYNIGGGEKCRVSTAEMFRRLYGDIGIKNLSLILKPKMQATRNFHGHYYLDSDKLENYVHFQRDSMEYYYSAYLKGLGSTAGLAKTMCKIPGGERLMATVMGSMFNKLADGEHGTAYFIKNNLEDKIEAYWGSRKAWEALPDDYKDLKHFNDWDKQIILDHGYDEEKPESELDIEDMKGAAKFRGGELLSETMEKGDWKTQLEFKCAFGHTFKASPRLVLEGGHWCDECERKSWNYGQRAKVDPFFAQVWNPLHEADELREYPKEVSELDVK
ncbi:MAG: NAD(P)-dependent oxidoreductase [Clostridia bacterium]|nr:NAD(P)-dependent oxidoreductase [Clostridia bacterium]